MRSSLRPVFRRVTASVLAVAVGLVPGVACTFVGAGIGARVDSRSTPAFVSTTVEKIRLGERLRVTPVDGMPVEGFFNGWEPDSGEPGLALPRVGDAVRVERGGRRVYAGIFVALDGTHVLLRPHGEPGRERIRLRDVVRLDLGPRGSLDGARLRALLEQGSVDPGAFLVVGDARIARADVARIERARALYTGTGATVGMLVGAAVDAAIVAVALHAWRAAWAPLGSCPHVASFDGRDFVLEAEAFPRAFLPSAPRTDRVALARLRAVDGALRLRVTNDQPEIQYVDALGLLAVDHPQGTRVVPALDGSLHALVAPQPPRRALDRAGRDWSAALRGADGRVWATDALGISARAGRVETLELEFARPPASASARLELSLRGTAWGYWLLRDVFALHGRDLPAFERRLDSDPVARGAFLLAYAREALPRVELWNGTAWRAAGVVANVGTAVNREQVLVLDLAGVPGDTLRVRLSVPPGMWRVDGIAADFEPEPVLEARRLTLLEARGDDGRERGPELAAADGRVVSMSPHEDAFEAAFAAPAERPGHARTYVLEATGAYRLLIPATGPPREAEFERLLREPGALLRYGVARAEAAREP